MAWRGLLALLLLVASAQAHLPTRSRLALALEDRTLRGDWHLLISDLDFAMGLDEDGDGSVTWGELKGRHRALEAYLLPHLRVATDAGDCPVTVREHLVEKLDDGMYAVVRLEIGCPGRLRRLTLDYDFLFDLDDEHKGTLELTAGPEVYQREFRPDNRRARIDLASGARSDLLREYLQLGLEVAGGFWPGWVILLALGWGAVGAPGTAGATWDPAGEAPPPGLDPAALLPLFLVGGPVISLTALKIVLVPLTLTGKILAGTMGFPFAMLLSGRGRAVASGAAGAGAALLLTTRLGQTGLPSDDPVFAVAGFSLGVGLVSLGAAVVGVVLGRIGGRFPRTYRAVLALAVFLAAAWSAGMNASP